MLRDVLRVERVEGEYDQDTSCENITLSKNKEKLF